MFNVLLGVGNLWPVAPTLQRISPGPRPFKSIKSGPRSHISNHFFHFPLEVLACRYLKPGNDLFWPSPLTQTKSSSISGGDSCFGLHHSHKRKVAQFAVGDPFFLVLTTISFKNCQSLVAKISVGSRNLVRFRYGSRRRKGCRPLLYKQATDGGKPRCSPPSLNTWIWFGFEVSLRAQIWVWVRFR